MSDAFLVLAQTDKGVSCFFVPRWMPDGTKNNIEIQRLKDKLGNKSNASSEIEFENALGWLVGEEGRGVNTIIEMVNHTRLDCTIGATALMRQATLQAIHHAYGRSAFGKKLIDQPLMTNVLADLAIEWEAALRLTFRVAASYDGQSTSPAEAHFKRLSSAIAKYWLCKRVPMHVAEALECLGGNGYVEESPMPRLFRESPLNGIWEGSGNVICLDVLRAIGKEPDALDVLIGELDKAAGLSSHVDRYNAGLKVKLAAVKKAVAANGAAALAAHEPQARLLVEKMAIALQACLMVRHSTPAAAEAFIASRIRRQSGLALGTLPRTAKAKAIVERAYLA
jgi:putative acyl-CoA dehydrogenase